MIWLFNHVQNVFGYIHGQNITVLTADSFDIDKSFTFSFFLSFLGGKYTT